MKIIRMLSLLVTILVAGCGGGGGGGGFLAEPTAVIDSGNAQAIAAAVVSGNLGLMQAVGSSGGSVGSQSANDRENALTGTLPRFMAAGAARSTIRSVSREATRVQPQVAFGPATEPCIVSGSVTISGNIANPPDLGPGDRLNATFMDCDDGDGYVMDGVLTLRLTAFSGDAEAGLFFLVADTTFSSLVITSGPDSGILNGTASFTVDTRDANLTLSRLVTDGLQFTFNGEVYQLADYDLSTEVTLDMLEYTLDVVGYLQDSSAFTGAVRINTLTPFAGVEGNFPSIGHWRITGAADATVAVEAVDAVDTLLHIDADGDGVAEENRELAWSELITG